ncbi:MAG: DUF3823 domain-containing protein [Ginsengibacter sp.]
MKKISIFLAAVFGIILLNGCELEKIDNYDGPNAAIYGGIYDIETNELVQQDIIRGSGIEYVENHYKNPETQYMVIKNDGTYRNNMMFANTYTIQPVRGNFVDVPKRGIEVKGETRVDFKVLPYIRIKNAKIEKVGTKIVATFNLQQNVSNNVEKIGLYAHEEPNVGEPLKTVSTQMPLGFVTYETTTYTLQIDLESNKNNLVPGKSYYFRVGALISAPEAKFNYAPAVRITL